MIFAITILAAQSVAAYPAAYGHALSTGLKPVTAKADAERDAKSGKCKLYVVQGYTLSIPHEPKNAKAYKIIVFDDTSDAYESVADRRANKTAMAYADAYNATSVTM